MGGSRDDLNHEFGKVRTVREKCPHCGQVLSPWQQVLLSVDRALICRECLYRIILDVADDPLDIENQPPPSR
jgi:hypothetical protein